MVNTANGFKRFKMLLLQGNRMIRDPNRINMRRLLVLISRVDLTQNRMFMKSTIMPTPNILSVLLMFSKKKFLTLSVKTNSLSIK